MLRLPSAPANANTNTNANDNNLISVVRDFLRPPTSKPTDFNHKSDGDESFWGSGRSYLFAIFAEVGSAADEGETQVHPHDEVYTSQL